MDYIVPDEMAAFLLITQIRNTLVAYDPARKLYAAPGGGIKPEDFCLFSTAMREYTEECGHRMKVVLADPIPSLFYINRDTRKIVPWRNAPSVKHLKLHAYFRMIEVSGEKPVEKEPKKFQKPAFQPLEFFRKEKNRLRPSLAQALIMSMQSQSWPDIATPDTELTPDLESMRYTLGGSIESGQMGLHPELVHSLTREREAA